MKNAPPTKRSIGTVRSRESRHAATRAGADNSGKPGEDVLTYVTTAQEAAYKELLIQSFREEFCSQHRES